VNCFLYYLLIIIFLLACEHLIRHMLVIEPEKRLSLNQIESHKWMKQVLKNVFYLHPNNRFYILILMLKLYYTFSCLNQLLKD